MLKINLTDVTFLFLVRLDTIDRLENTIASISFICENFNTNIKVLECAPLCNQVLVKMLPKEIEYKFKEDDDPILHRTKFLNEMLKEVTSPFVAVWDVDVIVPINQIILSVESLREKMLDFAYPYKIKFLDTSTILRKLYLSNKNIDFLLRHMNKMTELYPPNPVGGAYLCNYDAYKQIGFENENFYGWGVEDGERYMRISAFNYIKGHIDGPLFHLSHSRGPNSAFHTIEQEFIKRREFIYSINENNNKK